MNCEDACKFFAGKLKKITVFHLIVKYWDVLVEILRILKPAYDFTIASQSTQYTLSDLYLGWRKIMRTLESEMKRCNLKTKIAELFHEALDSRKKLLFDHPMMLCAVYLDPRVRFFLGPSEIQIAKMKLYELFERMETLREENCNELDKSVPIDSFEEFVKSQVHEPENESTKLDRCGFFLLHESFETMFPSIPHKRNIHEFWETEKKKKSRNL